MIFTVKEFDMFLNCPLMFCYKNIEALLYEKSYIEVVDELTHKLIAEITVNQRENFNIIISKHLEQKCYPENIKKRVYELLSRFVHWWDQAGFNPDVIECTELMFGLDTELKLCSYDDKDVVFRGIVDRIDRNEEKLILTDYLIEPANNDWMQLEVYALALFNSGNFKIEMELRLDYLQSGRTKTKTVSEKDMKSIKKRFNDLINRVLDAMDTDYFPALPSGRCEMCSYRNCCIEYQK